MRSDLVVTGLGTIGPHGAGVEALAAGLAQSRVVRCEVDQSPAWHPAQPARFAGRVDPAQLKPWIDAAKARRQSLPSRLAVAAGRMAFEDAGLERAARAGRDVAVSLGTAFGPNDFTAKLLDQIAGAGPQSASPFLFMESVANAHAGQVALDSELRGANITVVQREASGLLALIQGAACFDDGACELALVGMVDEMGSLTHGMLDQYAALSRGAAGGGELGRAFDAGRDGFFAAEGATLLVLERASDAAARGARVRARITGAVRANDPSAPRTDWGSGVAHLSAALARGMQRHGLSPADFDAVVSGASGSRRGDWLEAQVLKRVLGAEALPTVLAPKATLGEFGGGFLGAAILALSSPFGPTPGFESIDPELGIRPHDGRELAPPQRLLVSSLAAGGAAAWLFVDAP